jgi:signal transduction histidine kinase
VDRLADEQAALRRVATLVAHQTSPEEVFTAIAEEVGQLLGVEGTRLFRYERDHTATIVAAWGEGVFPVPVGSRVTLDGDNVASLVLRTERPARMDDYAKATGYLAAAVRERGVRSVVGAPILVAGRVWGAVVALSRQHESLAADFEARIGEFAELAGTAIANVQARSELAASRARIVAATDQARRQFERDLHDGAQQRLVSLALELREAEATAPAEHDDLRAQLSRAREDLNDVLENLRELSRGIHPAILSEGGLAPALRALKRRAALPIDLDVRVHGRLEEQVEVAAYYVVSEALTNAAKHAHASSAEVHAEVRDGALDLTIRDDGIGGADVGAGTGLTGLSDRVEALGGKLAIASSPGEGTSLHVELPLAAAAPPAPR